MNPITSCVVSTKLPAKGKMSLCKNLVSNKLAIAMSEQEYILVSSPINLTSLFVLFYIKFRFSEISETHLICLQRLVNTLTSMSLEEFANMYKSTLECLVSFLRSKHSNVLVNIGL